MPKKKELPHGRRLPAAVTRGKPCPRFLWLALDLSGFCSS
jgi:hypothetical protein